jgi:hypothetical protein
VFVSSLSESETEREMATDVAVLAHGVVEEKHSNASACCKTGPGYATPLEAMSGPREALIYVTCVYSGTPTSSFSISIDLASQNSNS